MCWEPNLEAAGDNLNLCLIYEELIEKLHSPHLRSLAQSRAASALLSTPPVADVTSSMLAVF